MTWLTVIIDHRCVPFVIIQSFPHSLLLTGFVTRVRRRVPLVEQELMTIPEQLSSTPIFMGLVMLNLLFFFSVLKIIVCHFFFRSWYCLSFILGIWLSLWYPQPFPPRTCKESMWVARYKTNVSGPIHPFSFSLRQLEYPFHDQITYLHYLLFVIMFWCLYSSSTAHLTLHNAQSIVWLLLFPQ